MSVSPLKCTGKGEDVKTEIACYGSCGITHIKAFKNVHTFNGCSSSWTFSHGNKLHAP